MKTAIALVLLALSVVPAAAWEQDGRTGTMFNDQSVSAPTPDQLARIRAASDAYGCTVTVDGKDSHGNDGTRYLGMGYSARIWTGSDGKTHTLMVYGADERRGLCMPDRVQ